ncbi:hypothetical protein IAT38_002357 [Cryptococcus sp. DSM 104549]
MATTASRVAQVKIAARSFPRTPLSEPVQISEALESILDRATAASRAITAEGQKASAKELFPRATHAERDLEAMSASLTRLKNGDAMRKYPLPKSILQPPNDEYFYTRARNAMVNAEKGIKRPFWKTFFGIKGKE